MTTSPSSSLIDRLIGIVTFKAPVYREVAHDEGALQPAAVIVLVVTLLIGVVNSVLGGAIGLVGAIVFALLGALIGWLIGSWLTALVANKLFQGQTNTTEMLRILGHTYVFQIPSIIPLIGPLVTLVLSIIGTVLAIREAASLDTQKSIFTAIVANVIIFVITLVLGGIVGGIFAAGVMMSGQ